MSENNNMDDIDLFLESIKIPEAEVVDTEWTPRAVVSPPSKATVQGIITALAWFVFVIAGLVYMRGLPQNSGAIFSFYTGPGSADYADGSASIQAAAFFFASAFIGACAALIRFIKKERVYSPSSIAIFVLTAISLVFAILIAVRV